MAIKPPGTYNTQEVLDLTGISRYTLHRFLKQKRFPMPINKTQGSGSANFFDRQEVDEWVAERATQLPATSVEPLNGEIEMSAHKRACAELNCTFEAYAMDSIRWKTRAILPDTPYMRPNLQLVS